MKRETIFAFLYGFGGGVIIYLVYILLSYLNVF